MLIRNGRRTSSRANVSNKRKMCVVDACGFRCTNDYCQYDHNAKFFVRCETCHTMSHYDSSNMMIYRQCRICVRENPSEEMYYTNAEVYDLCMRRKEKKDDHRVRKFQPKRQPQPVQAMQPMQSQQRQPQPQPVQAMQITLSQQDDMEQKHDDDDDFVYDSPAYEPGTPSSDSTSTRSSSPPMSKYSSRAPSPRKKTFTPSELSTNDNISQHFRSVFAHEEKSSRMTDDSESEGIVFNGQELRFVSRQNTEEGALIIMQCKKKHGRVNQSHLLQFDGLRIVFLVHKID